MPPLYTEAQHPLQVFPSQRERGSVAETLQFKKIQEGFPRQFEHIDGIYDQKQGLYLTSKGNLVRYYFCFNNLHNEWYRGLSPHGPIDIAMVNDLHHDGTSQEGVIGSTSERASQFLQKWWRFWSGNVTMLVEADDL